MKVVMEFKLPEESDAHACAVHGNEFWNTLWDIESMMRTKIKHGDISEETEKILCDIREMIWNTPGFNEVR